MRLKKRFKKAGEHPSQKKLNAKGKEKPKMIKYTNDYGITAEFESTIPEEQVKQRLSWMGKNFRRVD